MTKQERAAIKKKLEAEDPELLAALNRLGGFTQRERDLCTFVIRTISGVSGAEIKNLKEKTSSLASAARVAEVQAQIMGLRSKLAIFGERIDDIEEELSRKNE